MLDFRIEYYGARPPAPEDSEPVSASDPIGRCYALPCHVRFLPSLQVCLSLMLIWLCPDSTYEKDNAQTNVWDMLVDQFC